MNSNHQQLTHSPRFLHHNSITIGQGILHYLRAEARITFQGIIANHGKGAIFTVFLDWQSPLGFNTAYGFLGKDAGKPDVWAEYLGYDPIVFPSPKGENWVRLRNTDNQGEFDHIQPFWNRENQPLLLASRTKNWEFMGQNTYGAVFHSFNPPHPDHLQWVTWENGIPKPQKPIPLDYPYANWVILEAAGNINTLCHQPSGKFLHREFSPEGLATQHREIQLETTQSALIKLSFEADSHLFQILGEEIRHLCIAKDGTITQTTCCLLPLNGKILGIWNAISLEKGKWGTKFTYEGGDGWLITSEKEVLQAWTRVSGNKYLETISGRSFSLPFGDAKLYGVAGDGEGGFYAVFYPIIHRQGRLEEFAIYYSPEA